MRMLVLGAMVVIVGSLFAQEGDPVEEREGSLSVAKGVISLRVENREPVGPGDSFEPGVGQLACYTVIEGAADETVIYHVWRHGDELKAKVQLPVRSASWRTWSTKRILPSWTGDWTVTIEDEQGGVLETLSFSIQSASN